MKDFSSMLGVLEGYAAIWVIIGVGYGVGRLGTLGPNARAVLNKLTFSVASPALLFVTLAKADPYAVLGPQLLIATISAFAALAIYWVITARWLRRDRAERVVGAMAASTVNSANLGLPIAAYVLGDPALAAPVILFQLAIFTPVNLSMLDAATARSGSGVAGVLKGIGTNPMILASLAGLVVALLKWHIPDPVMEPIRLISGAAIPAMLMAFGISLVGSKPLRAANGRRADVLVAAGVKLLVHPAIALALAALVFRLEGPQLFGAVVLAALPTAQNIFVNASRYDAGIVIAKDTVLLTTVLGIPMMFVVAAIFG